MEIKKTTLSNGVRLVAVSMLGVESATVQIFVKAGSRQEEKRINGLAHFLEHMVFKGTTKYPTAQSIASLADSVGAEMNASTDKERTAYHLKVTEKNIPLALGILSQFIYEPLLNPEEIEREKGVIIQEIAMYEDLPPQKVHSDFEELLYGDTSLGWDIAGKRENIRGITREDFVQFRERYYHPKNMVLSVAGRFDFEELVELAEKYFGGDRESKESKDELVYKTSDEKVWLTEKKTEQTHLILGVLGNPLGHKDRYTEAVLSAVLGGGMSSRMFTEVREKRGLAYYVKAMVEHYTDTGYAAVRAGVEVGKVDEAISVIVEQLLGVSKDLRITNEEMEKAREYYKGRFILGLEDTEHVSDFFGEMELLEGRVRSLEEIREGLNAVTLDDLHRVAEELYKPERLRLAIIGPYNDKSRFGKLLIAEK